MSLVLTPITFAVANAFVADKHRHHKPVIGCKFVLGISDETGLRGVLIAGRPTARMSDDGFTLEVTRCCTDGVHNGCSMLYGASVRVAWAMGYRRVITYTLPEEGGASLRGAGLRCLGERGGGSWSRPKLEGRTRTDKHPLQAKLGWEVTL